MAPWSSSHNEMPRSTVLRGIGLNEEYMIALDVAELLG